MATTLTALYVLGLPLVGTIVAVAATLLAWTDVKNRAEPSFAKTRGMRNVFAVLPVTITLFGFSFYTILQNAPQTTAPAIL